MQPRTLSLLAAFATIFTTATANAGELGERGHLVVSCAIEPTLCISTSSFDPGGTTRYLHVGVDLFATRQWTLGLAPTVVRYGGFASSTGAVVRVGRFHPLGRGLALWPRLGLSYDHSQSDWDDVGGGASEATSSTTGVVADLGVVTELAHHVLLTVTPTLTMLATHGEASTAGLGTLGSTDTMDTQTTTLDVQAGLAVWW